MAATAHTDHGNQQGGGRDGKKDSGRGGRDGQKQGEGRTNKDEKRDGAKADEEPEDKPGKQPSRSKPKPNRIESVAFVGTTAASAKTAVQRGARIADAVAVARDLVNEPGGELTPPVLADPIRLEGVA